MTRIALALLAALLVTVPFYAGDFYVNLASQILIAAIFALSLNLLVGYGGMTSLGHASFLGVAAYISALLTTRYGLGHGMAALLSIAGTTLTAAFFGVIALRASGLGFLMITLALSQVLWGLAYRMSNLTNGDTIRQFPGETGLQQQYDWVANGAEPNKQYGVRGISSGRMPHFGTLLTKEQIDAIIAYERSL